MLRNRFFGNNFKYYYWYQSLESILDLNINRGIEIYDVLKINIILINIHCK